ncbi:aminotransferase class V-fold PLP-dependent enzyme [Acidobacteriota bacterium]
METNRRDFLKSVGIGIGSLGMIGLNSKTTLAKLNKKLEDVKQLSPLDVARDEDFWFYVQQAFNIDRSIINLNNGGVHPCPTIVMDAVKRYMDFSNGAPVYNSWRVLRPRKELIRKRLAETFGCSPEEIAITRNVTESLQIALLGIQLNAGDEVITTTHDYPSMKNALYQRQLREDIVVKTLPFHYPPKNLTDLVDLFEKNITSKTKMILMCHATNLTGQIFPVKEICRMARMNNIEVVIDGAHAFAHFDFKQKDLDCDFYGANLHKWMMAPIGTGCLYIKKERIKDIWPLFPAADPLSDDIRKFEHVGTQPEALKLAVGDALTFHHGIGAKRKEERLRYLRNYWAHPIEKLKGAKMLFSFDPKQSCGVATYTIENFDMAKLSQILWQKHNIYNITVGVPPAEEGGESTVGMRVTPSIYTTLPELDMFVKAVTFYVNNGLPNGV